MGEGLQATHLDSRIITGLPASPARLLPADDLVAVVGEAMVDEILVGWIRLVALGQARENARGRPHGRADRGALTRISTDRATDRSERSAAGRYVIEPTAVRAAFAPRSGALSAVDKTDGAAVRAGA